MSDVFVKRKFTFAASHRLHSSSLSDEENKIIYGKCNNRNGHGHNYTLIVTMKGSPDPTTGMFVNLTEVKAVLEETVGRQFDHKNLDLDTTYFVDRPSTAENIAIVIWDMLKESTLAEHLYSVEIIETENNSAVYYGE